MTPNPKDYPNRLATAATFLPTWTKPFGGIVREMCDLPILTSKHIIERGRIYKFVYFAGDGDNLSLVDEWDVGTDPREPPCAAVYASTSRLLAWSGATAVRGDLVERGSLELHEHVKRMDMFFKYRMVQNNFRHEFELDNT